MRSALVAGILVGLLLTVLVISGRADHVPIGVSSPQGFPTDHPYPTNGSSGQWRFVANFPMGPGTMQPLGTDVERFVRDGKVHVIVGSMTLGFRIFRYDSFAGTSGPVPVSDYASAFGCPNATPDALIQNKVEGDEDLSDAIGAVSGWQDDVQVNAGGTLVSIATDADGRCHDPAGGGVELVDISTLTAPRLFHLVRSFGEAHNNTIDKRRGLIFISSSDTQLNAIDIIDFRSCVPPASDPVRFENCRPAIARFQFPVPHTLVGQPVDVPAAFKDPRFPEGLTAGAFDKGNNGCHDITIQGTFMYCAAINATVIFDISGVTQRNISPASRKDGSNCVSLTDPACRLTGTHLTDQQMIDQDRDPNAAGLPPACPIVDGDPALGRPQSVTDCEKWARPTSGTQEFRYEADDFMRANLRQANVKIVSVIQHGGTTTPKGPTEDISISHEADPTEDGKMLIVTDERGGGLTNVCDGTPPDGGGGAWFYDIRDKARPKLLKQPDGTNGVFISQRTPVPGNCTIHVIVQVPATNVIVAGWYIEGTHVFAFDPDLGRRLIRFAELGHYVPGSFSSPNTWTSYPVALEGNVLFIQTGDMTRGTDVLAFTVPSEFLPRRR